MTVPAPRHKVWHKHFPYTYLDENSPWGLRHARNRGFPWIDLDAIPSLDFSIRNVHGPTIGRFSGYHDPRGVISRRTRVDSLTDRELDRLRSRRGRMPYMEDQIRLAERVGMNIELEMKPSDLWRFGMLSTLLAVAKRRGVKVWVKTLTTPGWERRMRVAHSATQTAGHGVTVLLNHSRRPVILTAEQSRQIDYCRGPFRVER